MHLISAFDALNGAFTYYTISPLGAQTVYYLLLYLQKVTYKKTNSQFTTFYLLILFNILLNK